MLKKLSKFCYLGIRPSKKVYLIEKHADGRRHLQTKGTSNVEKVYQSNGGFPYLYQESIMLRRYTEMVTKY